MAPLGFAMTAGAAAVPTMAAMAPTQGPHNTAPQGERKPCKHGNLDNTSDEIHVTLLGWRSGRTLGQRPVRSGVDRSLPLGR